LFGGGTEGFERAARSVEKDAGVRAEVDAVGGGQDVPDVVKFAVGLRQLGGQRNELQLAGGGGGEIAEGASSADKDGAAGINGEGSGELAGDGDFAPLDAVEFQDAVVVGDEDEAAKILDDGPALRISAVLGGRVGVNEECASFGVETGARWNEKRKGGQRQCES